MFGLSHDNQKGRSGNVDSLPMLVSVVQNSEVFELGQRVWMANSRSVRRDPNNGKEFLRFGLVTSARAAWLERDANRNDAFELIITWWDDKKQYADIYVVTPQPGAQPSGDDRFARQALQALLTTPATLPADRPSTQ